MLYVRLKTNMPASSYIYLELTGEFSLEEVSSSISLIPYESWAKHTRFPNRKIPRTSTLAFAKFETDEEVPDVYSLSEKLVDVVEPHSESIARAIRKYNMQCCLHVVLLFASDESISTPIIGFTERVTRLLAKFSASIDIDTYRR